jgi:hypothetical protein
MEKQKQDIPFRTFSVGAGEMSGGKANFLSHTLSPSWLSCQSNTLQLVLQQGAKCQQNVIENVIENVILLLPRSNPDMQAQFLSRGSQDKTSLPHALSSRQCQGGYKHPRRKMCLLLMEQNSVENFFHPST